MSADVTVSNSRMKVATWRNGSRKAWWLLEGLKRLRPADVDDSEMARRKLRQNEWMDEVP